MNQVSRPMQILLGAVLVFAVLWFVALKPKTAVEEPIAAAPVTPATTPRSAAGGAEAQTGLGKAVESANNVAAQSNSATAKAEAQTGEQTPAPNTSTPATKAPAANGSAANGSAAKGSAATKAAKADEDGGASSAQQKKANRTITAIKRDLAARRAAVVLVYQAKGKEDKILLKRVKNDINRRGGKVRTYYVHVSQVGYYDGLLSGLNLGQTPSTIVIAPDNQAKVLGGLTSTERIDRLTSSAIQTPVATTP